jgi:hypothetical protein
MFTLEQNFVIVQCYFRNGERLENGEWSYSTPRVFDKFQEKFLRKKGSRRPKKDQLKILKRLNKELQRPQISPSGN